MDEEAQPAGTDPLTVEQLLKSILDVLTCMDSAVHRLEDLGSEGVPGAAVPPISTDHSRPPPPKTRSGR